jgi:site-specific DNA recombinase
MLRTSFERIEVSPREIRLIGSKPRLLQGVIQTGGEDQKDGADWQSMPSNDEDRFVMAIALDGVFALEKGYSQNERLHHVPDHK